MTGNFHENYQDSYIPIIDQPGSAKYIPKIDQSGIPRYNSKTGKSYQHQLCTYWSHVSQDCLGIPMLDHLWLGTENKRYVSTGYHLW